MVRLVLACHHEDAVVDVENVHVVAIQGAEHILADDFFGRAAGRAARSDLDHAVHHRQQRVHLMG